VNQMPTSARGHPVSVRLLRKVERRIGIPPRAYAPLAARAYSAAGGWDVRQYAHPPNPVDPITVEPEKVRHMTGRKWKAWEDRHLLVGSVRPGDWDITPPAGVPAREQPYPRRFDDYSIHVSFRQRFQEGMAWDRTERYGRQFHHARKRGRSSLDALQQKVARFDSLFETLSRDGYRSQLELCARSTYFDSLLNEICVDIGRDGEILFVDGRHRLSMVKILGIRQVPACVLVRHEDWMTARAAHLKSGRPPVHPDL
jgi:hypothetical protein